MPKSFRFASPAAAESLPLCVRGGAKSLILLGGVVLIVSIPQSPQCGDPDPFTQGGLAGCVPHKNREPVGFWDAAGERRTEKPASDEGGGPKGRRERKKDGFLSPSQLR